MPVIRPRSRKRPGGEAGARFLFLFLFLFPTMPPLNQLLEVSLYANDLDASQSFYTSVLGLEVASLFDDAVAFRCGGQVILIFDPARSRSSERSVPPHGADGSGHIAFPVHEAELAEWRAHLERLGVEIEREVSWQAGTSIYFRDPAGNLMELAPPNLWTG